MRYVCGYKKGIDKIFQYIKLAGITARISDIASLGEHEILNSSEQNQDNEVVDDTDFRADKQKYFTAITM